MFANDIKIVCSSDSVLPFLIVCVQSSNISSITEDVLEATQSIDFDKGDVIIKKSGIYLVIAGPQIAKLRGARNRWIDFWLRVNNVDLPNSNVRRVLTDSQEKDVIPLNAVCPLNRGDTLNIMMAAETEGEGIGIEALQPDGEPTIPSVILTLVQLD